MFEFLSLSLSLSRTHGNSRSNTHWNTGTGSSAYINGYDYVEFDHSASFGEANEEYSMTMWVFMIQEPTTTSSKWCPIVHKGTSWC